MGLLTVLRNVLGIPKPPSASVCVGPGTQYLTTTCRDLRPARRTPHAPQFSFAVHELLFPGQQPSVAADVADIEEADEIDVRRESECIGRDIWCDDQGFWRGIVDIPSNRHRWGALVDAGPIEHRDPCIGYVIREIPQFELRPVSPLPRKLVILGDTYDPFPLIPLIHDDLPMALSHPAALPDIDPTESGHPIRIPVSLLVHEATDAYLPPNVDPHARTGRNRTQQTVEEKTRARGHSTPAMAGAFARRIGAERLVLNHIGARFPAPDTYSRRAQDKFRLACMREIERQAAHAWGPAPARRRVHPQAAWDFMYVAVPPNPFRDVSGADAPDKYGHGAGPSGGVGGAGDREMATEIEMEDATLPHERPPRAGPSGRGGDGGRGAGSGVGQNAQGPDTHGRSAESMGARHHDERYRKRTREGSSGWHEGGGGGGNGGGRGGADSRRGGVVSVLV
ncbi:hypothetical protein BD413DRAFT_651103 [Trametes elegans]|nr:hypothetical protein BD413DRAFT_651103 [Trametes elegans]